MLIMFLSSFSLNSNTKEHTLKMIFVCILVEPLRKNLLFQIINVSQKVWSTKPLLWMNNLIGALQMF